MKPESSTKKPVSPLVTNNNLALSNICKYRLKAIEEAAIREAEKEASAAAGTSSLRKSSSEIMIESEIDEDQDQLSFIKYLSPKSAALVQKAFAKNKQANEKYKASSSQGKKNLKLA